MIPCIWVHSQKCLMYRQKSPTYPCTSPLYPCNSKRDLNDSVFLGTFCGYPQISRALPRISMALLRIHRTLLQIYSLSNSSADAKYPQIRSRALCVSAKEMQCIRKRDAVYPQKRCSVSAKEMQCIRKRDADDIP